MNIYILGDVDASHLEYVANNVYQLSEKNYSIETDSDNKSYIKVDTTRVVEVIANAKVSSDKMSASISLYPSINSENDIDLETLFGDIERRYKISAKFIDRTMFNEAIEHVKRGYIIENIECAQGIPVQHGTNARLEFFFDMPKVKPKIMENGHVDYKETQQYIMAREGQLLVRIVPATEGVKGVEVTGVDIVPIPGVKKEIQVGDGVLVDIDQTEYKAAHSGYIVYENNKISVFPMVRIIGNLDFKVGNIHFEGPVHVSKDVLPGFTINADEIVIEGIDEDAILVSRGDIIINTGIKGLGNKGYVKAGGNVKAGYSENASIQAAGSVEIEKYCFNTKIYAHSVSTTTDAAVVTGGAIRAFSTIRIANAGTKGTNDMLLAVGTSPIYDEKAKKIAQEIEKLNASLEKLDEVLSQLDLNNINIIHNPKVSKMIESAELIRKNVPLLQKKYEELNKKARCDDPRIIIEKSIKVGVQIQFYDTVITMKDDMGKVEFYYNDATDEIEFDII